MDLCKVTYTLHITYQYATVLPSTWNYYNSFFSDHSILGRRLIPVKVCAAPKRERSVEEENVVKGKQKRSRTSNNFEDEQKHLATLESPKASSLMPLSPHGKQACKYWWIGVASLVLEMNVKIQTTNDQPPVFYLAIRKRSEDLIPRPGPPGIQG